MEKDFDVLANIARSFLTYMTVTMLGSAVAVRIVPRIFSVFLELINHCFTKEFGALSSLLCYVPLAMLSLLVAHIIASGWNKTAGAIVASAEYLYSGYLIWYQLGGQKILALACLLFIYAVCAFLFMKFQKETKFGREYFKWGSLVIFALLIVVCIISPSIGFSMVFPIISFILPGSLSI